MFLKQDEDITGRLEATLFWGTTNPGPNSVGYKFHSKLKGQGFANDHFRAFDKRLEEAIAKAEEDAAKHP